MKLINELIKKWEQERDTTGDINHNLRGWFEVFLKDLRKIKKAMGEKNE